MGRTVTWMSGLQFKVISSVGSLVMCLGAYFVISTAAAQRNVATLKRASEQVFPALQAADSNIFLSERLKESLNAAVATRELDELKAAELVAEQIRRGFTIIKERDADDAARAAQVLELFNHYYAEGRALSERLILTKADFGSPEITAALASMRRSSERFTAALKEFRTQCNDGFTQSISEASLAAGRVVTLGYALTLLSVLAFVGILFRLRRGIVTPISRLSRLSQEVSHGAFPMVPAPHGYDEIAVLYANFAAMVRGIEAHQDDLNRLATAGRQLASVVTMPELAAEVGRAAAALARDSVETSLVFSHECFLEASLAPGFYQVDAQGQPLVDAKIQHTELTLGAANGTQVVWVVDPKSHRNLAAIRVSCANSSQLSKSLASLQALATHVASAIALVRLEVALTLLASKKQQVQTILDHANFGLMICDRDLRIRGGYSRACNELFGTKEDLQDRSLLNLLQLSGRSADSFALVFAEIFDATSLTAEFAVLQLPTRIKLGERSLGLSGSVVKDSAGVPTGVLFCLSDITAFVAAEVENSRNHSLIKMLANRESLRQFVKEATISFRRMGTEAQKSGGNQLIVQRLLHTLKGDCITFGLQEVADTLHHLEESPAPSVAAITAAEEQFFAFFDRYKDILGLDLTATADDLLSVPEADVRTFEEQAELAKTAAEHRAVLQALLRRLRLQSARTLLGPIDESIAQLALRLGKDIDFVLQGGNTPIQVAAVPVLRNLPHLLRNAVDHGLEPRGQRSHKPAVGHLSLTLRDNGEALEILVVDDGQGINRTEVLARAVTHGLVTPTEAAALSDEEALALIFAPGVSTAREVSETSGRGVGMAAVKAAVESASGSIQVASQPGEYTKIRIEIPHHMPGGPPLALVRI